MEKGVPVSVWPEWQLIEKIGEGSFGKVYKAQRTERRKSFYSAIKIINIPGSQSELNSVRSETGDEQSTRQYFQNLVEECIQEISTMEYFRGNSYIVSVEDFKVMEYLDVIGWEISIRMEYLTSFMDYCAEKQLTEKEVVKLGMDLSKALEYCRKLKIIHRDIKPENIFVSRFGDFKLGDFGIARELERTMSGFSKKGTYSYMAPEMYKGKKYDSRVDIYSLGITIYEMATGKVPFDGENTVAIALMHLRDLGNSLIVVEHDEDTMRAADCIVDIGPGAGEHGGQLVAMGTAEDLMKNEDSITGAYLSGKLKIPVPLERRKPTGFLTVKGAAENNLKNIDVKIPLGIMTCITGVSGSGKSSLINEILYKRLARDLNRARVIPGKHKDILGTDQLDKVINIDQSPIGRTPRSNPATYTGVFDQIRDLFAATADAKAKGYKKGRFSFNVKGGRCEACSGDGIIKIEMHFLPDVYVPCEVCKGKRYNRETLEVKYKDKNIYDVLNMTVEEALTFFENVPSIKRKIQTLYDVGLSYIRLGQPSTELSGGEAQRIKLATELSKRSTGKTIYILDEPTTGLHFADVHKLVEILKRLSEGGNTVVVIEHNLDVIKTADYIIDIGPEGGDKGGTVVAMGTPEEVAQSPVSYTGKYVKKYLK